MACLPWCVMLLGHVMVAHGNMFDWKDNPYDNRDFNVEVEFGQAANLTCENTIYNDTTKISVRYWITPDLRVFLPGDTENEPTLDGPMSWTVSSDGMVMALDLISPLHFGFYYCVADYDGNTNKPVVVKKALNYLGPYFGDLWEKYEMSVIIGLSAVGGLVALLALGCVVDRYCCVKQPSDGEWKMGPHDQDTIINGTGHENGGYDRDGPDGVQLHGNGNTELIKSKEDYSIPRPALYPEVDTQF